MLKQVVLLCGVFAFAYAALARGPLEPKPDKFKDVPGCYISKLDAVVPLGEARPAPVPECMEYRCGEDLITYVSCGAVARPPSSELFIDETKPFPECCPKVRLLKDDGKKDEEENMECDEK